MRIAIVRRHCSLKKGGAERYCVNLFRSLKQLGHDVTIVGEAIDDELKQEVDFIPVPVLKLTSWTKNKSFFENTRRVLQQYRFDIVHGLSRVGGLDTFRLTERLQLHWVNMFYRHPMTRLLQHLNPRHRVVFDLEQQIFGPTGVRRVIVQSKLDARLLQQYFGVDEMRICQIINGVDTRTFHPGVRADRSSLRDEWRIESNAPLLVFASMDFRGKGLDSLLTAMARLKHRETRLIVVGQGSHRPFEQQARSLGLKDRVIFAGRQTGIQRFYGAADLFVLPTIYEPFPNVNLEAMACGTPVISTATSGGSETIAEGDNGYLIRDAWAIDELAEKIDHYLDLSATEKERMSSTCWQTASRLKIVDNASKVALLFEAVLAEKNAA